MVKHKSTRRALNGLLLLDKPKGESSNRVLQKVKRIFNAAKAGHTGTLDPLATGLLIICFGKATKISDYLLTADKQYHVTLKLGVVTSTGDADGEILKQFDASKITSTQIIECAKQLTGELEQIPPMYSALKHKGTRLYELARKGEEIERAPRKVKIHEFEYLTQRQDLVTMHVHCSKGTYIRTLVEDLGKLLNCGAHVVELRRTSLGSFVNPTMHTISELERRANDGYLSLDEVLLPTDQVLCDWPAISVDEMVMLDICHGRPIELIDFPAQGMARIYNVQGEFYGMAKLRKDGSISIKCLN